LAWAEAEEKREAESAQGKERDWSPTSEDKAWMEDQIAHGKEAFGEDFGEDINEDF
jgi:hypothetical protein